MNLHLIVPDNGELVFDGDTVAQPQGIDVGALRRQMQMVFQDSHSSLNPRMPVRDSVAFGPFVEGKAKDDARDIAGDMLSKVGLDPGLFHHERGRQEGCRIAMIRAVDLAQQHNRIRPSARRRLVAIQFVLDSPLEGTGFEPSVPPVGHRSGRGRSGARCECASSTALSWGPPRRRARRSARCGRGRLERSRGAFDDRGHMHGRPIAHSSSARHRGEDPAG